MCISIDGVVCAKIAFSADNIPYKDGFPCLTNVQLAKFRNFLKDAIHQCSDTSAYYSHIFFDMDNNESLSDAGFAQFGGCVYLIGDAIDSTILEGWGDLEAAICRARTDFSKFLLSDT